MQQNTEEWRLARCGCVTASRMRDVLARTRSGVSEQRRNYLAELVCERVTGMPADNNFQSAAMLQGSEREPLARAAYSWERATDVVEVGFVPHPKIAMSGASPDGLVGKRGLIEIKCPIKKTHLQTLLTGGIDPAYVDQMMWQLACTGRDWCDYVSYDPSWPAGMQLFIHRVDRDDSMIAHLEKQVVEFLREVDDTIAALRSAGYLKKAA